MKIYYQAKAKYFKFILKQFLFLEWKVKILKIILGKNSFIETKKRNRKK